MTSGDPTERVNIEEQEKRLASLSLEEWHAPFLALAAAIEEYPAEVDLETISDEELVKLVHRLRENSSVNGN